MNVIIASFEVKGQASFVAIFRAQKGAIEEIFDLSYCCNIPHQ